MSIVIHTGVAVTIAAATAAAAFSQPSASVTPASAASRTCAAFRAWDAHRTSAHLDALMTDSESVPWKYIGEDASGLYSDVRSGAKAKYIVSDIRYFESDCASA